MLDLDGQDLNYAVELNSIDGTNPSTLRKASHNKLMISAQAG